MPRWGMNRNSYRNLADHPRPKRIKSQEKYPYCHNRVSDGLVDCFWYQTGSWSFQRSVPAGALLADGSTGLPFLFVSLLFLPQSLVNFAGLVRSQAGQGREFFK